MTEHSSLDIAKAHRAAVMGSVARLTEERRRLSAVEGAERDAVAALADLGRQEVAAAREWASTGAAGTAPAVDAAKRAELTAAVVTAEAATAAARGAGAGVDAELAEATSEVARLSADIERAAVDELAGAFLTGIEALQDQAAAFRGEVAKTYAIVAVLRDRAEDLQAHGRADEARRLFASLERLGGHAAFDTIPSRAEVATHTPTWAIRLADLAR